MADTNAATCRKQGLHKCKGVCVDLSSDPNHCGSCKNTCPSGTCTNGQCAAAACTASSTCTNSIQCGGSRENCECLQSTNGGFICAKPVTGDCAEDPACTSDGDCNNGANGNVGICVPNYCTTDCGGPSNGCVCYTPGACASTMRARDIFSGGRYSA